MVNDSVSSPPESSPVISGEIAHTKHLFRALFLLVGALLVGGLARCLFYPKSFGVAGPYRLDNIAEHNAKELVYGGPDTCAQCHARQWNAKAKGRHATLSCEICHPPGENPHAKDGTKTTAIIKRDNGACLICHQKLESRPHHFPQVDPEVHVRRWMKRLPEARMLSARCLECHEDPHGLE